jgi:hypothetical protein
MPRDPHRSLPQAIKWAGRGFRAPSEDNSKEQTMRLKMDKPALLGLLAIGGILSVGITDAQAQIFRRGPGGFGPRGYRPIYVQPYGPQVFVAPAPVVVTQGSYVVATPTVIEREVIQSAPVVQTRYIQPAPIVETRTVLPPPVVERRVVQPPPVVETRVVQPPAVEERRVVQPPPVVERRVIQPPAVEEREVVQPSTTVEKDVVVPATTLPPALPTPR